MGKKTWKINGPLLPQTSGHLFVAPALMQLTAWAVSFLWMNLCMCLDVLRFKNYVMLHQHCIYVCWDRVWSWVFSFVGTLTGKKVVAYRFSASGIYKSTFEPVEELFNSGKCPGKLEGKSLLLHQKQLSAFILKRNTYFCACQRLGKSFPDSGTRMHNSTVTLIVIFVNFFLLGSFHVLDTSKLNIWLNTWSLTPKELYSGRKSNVTNVIFNS